MSWPLKNKETEVKVTKSFSLGSLYVKVNASHNVPIYNQHYLALMEHNLVTCVCTITIMNLLVHY